MVGNPSSVSSPKLLDQVHGKIRLKHYSIRTEQTYMDWINASFYSRTSDTARYAGHDSSRLFRQDLARAGRISAVSLLQAATTMWFLPRVQCAAGLPHRWRAGGAAARPCGQAPAIRRQQSSRAVPRACANRDARPD